MPRAPRAHCPGALYLLSSQGGSRSLFEDERDREVFLEILATVIRTFAWKCHAYCLTDNGYTLLVETPPANLSRGMRQLNGMYTLRFNSRHQETGPLFSGRFKSVVAEKERFLPRLGRMVVRLPVQTGLVRDPGDWPWSSFRATAGLLETPAFLSPGGLLSALEPDSQKAQAAYRVYVLRQDTPELDLPLGAVLGSRDFVERVTGTAAFAPVSTPPEHTEARPDLEMLFSATASKQARNLAIHTAHVGYGYTLKAIGEHLGLHYSTVSKIAAAKLADLTPPLSLPREAEATRALSQHRPGGAPPGRRMRPQEERILDRALEIIAREGFQALTMRHLASRMRMSAPNLYNYFANKDELFRAIRERGFRMLLESCHAARARHEDPRERLRDIVETYLNFGIEHRACYDTMFTRPDAISAKPQGPLEPLPARDEQELPLSILRLARAALQEVLALSGPCSHEKARLGIIQLWSLMHGMIHLHNSGSLVYMSEKTRSDFWKLMDDYLLSLAPPP